MIEILLVSFVVLSIAIAVYIYSKKESKQAKYLWVGTGKHPFKKHWFLFFFILKEGF